MPAITDAISPALLWYREKRNKDLITFYRSVNLVKSLRHEQKKHFYELYRYRMP